MSEGFETGAGRGPAPGGAGGAGSPAEPSGASDTSAGAVRAGSPAEPSAASDATVVAAAVAGDQDALAEVLRRVQDQVYRLALRMTGTVPDAEDATQEILIRVMTRLASFRGEAALTTWAYRIGVNHLVNARRAAPIEALTFDAHGRDLLAGLAAPAYTGPDAVVLADEIRLLCTQALLQCLDRSSRAAYVVGDILRLSGDDAAWVLGVPAATYRKRLERARRDIRDALRGKCGLLDAAAPCHCAKRINYAKDNGRIAPAGPVFATHPAVTAKAEALGRLRSVGELLRSHPDYAAPAARTEALLALVRSGTYRGLLPDEAE